MAQNQIGELNVTKMPSALPPYSRDVDGVGPWHPAHSDGLRPQVGLTWPVAPRGRPRQRPLPDMRPVSAQEMRAALADEPDLLLVSEDAANGSRRGWARHRPRHPSRCEGGPERPLGALPPRHGAPSLACEHIVTMKDPLFAPIRFEWDLENRRARIEASTVTCFRIRQ